MVIVIEGKGLKMLVRREGASWGEGGRRMVVDSNAVGLKLSFQSRPRRRFKVAFQIADQDRGPSTSARASKSCECEGVLTREMTCEQW